jgi:hypothetical protein
MGMQTTLDVLLRKFWKLKIGILAALFTGAETLVSMGYQLPGSRRNAGVAACHSLHGDHLGCLPAALDGDAHAQGSAGHRRR